MFDPIAYLENPAWRVSKLGLDRIAELMERLSRPERTYRIVHVAGTNGKGSTAAFVSSVLQHAGNKVGLFTSPTIGDYASSILVNGEPIPPEDLCAVTRAVREAAEAMDDHPTEFELACAVSFLWFERARCDVAVIEVGLGGALDSTNVIEAPELCLFARIALDHTGVLGATLGEIASEKAGIVKRGASVVSWPQEPEAMQAIERAAEAYGASVRTPDFGELSVSSVELSKDGTSGIQRFRYRGYDNLSIGLLGSYQPYNAALAIEAIEALRERGWAISDEALRCGLAEATWHGRFEIAAVNPTFVIDGGHNPQGARALADSLKRVFPGRKAVFVIGVLADKDYPEMLEELLPLGSAFIVIEPPNLRALPAEKLARAIRWTGQDLLGCSACTNPYIAEDIPDAVAKAREIAGPDGLVCACGSLYSIAEIERAL